MGSRYILGGDFVSSISEAYDIRRKRQSGASPKNGCKGLAFKRTRRHVALLSTTDTF